MAKVRFTTTICRFRERGEKSGWTYIEIPADKASTLNPGCKKSFRVKGALDHFLINGASLLPMGNGHFILPLNAAIRKGVGKREGASLLVTLETDNAAFKMDADMMLCLKEEPAAYEYFITLTGSHQRYFSKWVSGAKYETTKARRIARIILAMLNKWSYAEMLRAGKIR
ncbi:MAG: DUF1905 domain-containing protein [Bacteroidia bacterium]|nr:DUF1905 domain-containing protein [Bacteroidia bacterium]